MKLSEPYEDDGEWYCNVIDPEDGVDVRPVGTELKMNNGSWTECAQGGSRWVRGYEYRIPAKPPEPKAPASTAPKSWQLRHDPWVPPQPLRLEDVPDGRCIQNPEDPEEDKPLYWRHVGNWFCRHRFGTIAIVGGNGTTLSEFTVTDYIAEFREASC